MTTETIEAPDLTETLIDPATVNLTEQEAVNLAIDGLRELIDAKYHFCNRYNDMMGERLPAIIKQQQARRITLLAAIMKLQALDWWAE